MSKRSAVGYGRPPKQTQFKKGRSGNPHGRPKGSVNFGTMLTQEFSEQITVREDGKSRRISKQRALIKTLLAKALQGDVKASSAVLALHMRVFADVSQEEEISQTKDELLILQRFAPRLIKSLEQKRTRK